MDPVRRSFLQSLAGIAATAVLPSPSIARPPAKADGLRVMTFNIWNGGTHREPLSQTAEVILRAEADLVGLQEVKQSGPELAKLTGMTFFAQPGDSRGILTRYPIVEEDSQGWGVRVDVNGRRVWLFNCHLNHQPYQPYQLAGIRYGDAGNPLIDTAAEAIAEAQRARGLEVAQMLMAIGRALKTEDPVFVTGDFNEPACLDWTAETVQAGRCPAVVVWPSSRCLIDAGLTDSFRQVHPDPVQHPGHTWTPKQKERHHDRIDLIFHTEGRGLVCRSAEIVGEGSERADIVVDPYPSDHRAVVCRFDAIAD